MSEQNTKLTKQDLFNNAWQAFVVEKSGPSVADCNLGVHCLYLATNGCRCGIGVSIPSSVLQAIVENDQNNLAIDRLMRVREDVRSLFGEENTVFMTILQTCHDGPALGDETEFSEAIEEELRDFAAIQCLQIPQ